MSKQQQRVLVVLERIVSQVIADEAVADAVSEVMQEALNELNDQDLFGTEGQLDPRGDQTDGAWSMDRVQGVDL